MYVRLKSSNQGIRKKVNARFFPKKGLDLILWPSVNNEFGDDFVPHNLVFYEIF